MDSCPCGSTRSYADCCRPLISGDRRADTAEQVMRSRYTAYVRKELGWLRDSLHPGHRADFDEASSRAWAERAEWHGIEFLRTEKGGPGDEEGTVEFVVSFSENGVRQEHHELSSFQKTGGTWYFSTGKALDSFRWNNRLHHQKDGSFSLCDDPEALVKRVSVRPLCTVVRAKSRFVQGGRQPACYLRGFGGQVGSAIEGVKQLAPEAEERDRLVRELADQPNGGEPQTSDLGIPGSDTGDQQPLPRCGGVPRSAPCSSGVVCRHSHSG